ncbi:uncharacterized protein [Chironomus tepperi]|uniref:uncharacterized protein isoform X1 n=1 Tax=Chironomus tepperi TaxID=113505 RepID=UPI00391F6A15
MTVNINICYLVVIILIKFTNANSIRQCPDYQIQFEKILGYRPPQIVLSNNYGSATGEKILLKYHDQVPSVINLSCMELCKNDHNCESYVLNFNKSECYGYTSNERQLDTHNFRRFDDHELVEDINVIYFVKTCLNIPLNCKNTLYPILRIPGSILIGKGYLTINKLLTRRECIERCLFETTFKCRSVSFQISQRNNIVRMGLSNILNKNIMGRCIMSRDDKNLEPDSFRVAPINDEYIENNCQVVMNGANEQFLDDFCSYEHFPDSALTYAEHQYIGLTDHECQEKCYKEKKFFCKGITYQHTDRVDDSRCFIHSEDLISLGPRAVIPMLRSYYLKRVQCLNLNVRCTHDQMIIRYNPRQFFQGRMYTENHPEECGVSGTNYGPTFLTIPIGTELKENRCGVARAFDYESLNRTLIYVYVIIQNNPLVMMQSDRYIKVGCISKFNRHGNEDGVPDYVSLETSMEFNGKDYDGSGSLVIDSGGDIPKLRIYIVDPIDNVKIKEARIGQILKFVISMDSHYENYDLRAVNLTATSSYDKLEMISSSGCPTNAAIFPGFQQEITDRSRRLYSKFKAFKFASSAQIKFSVSIQFCHKSCMPVNCGYGVVSNGRKKRATSAGIVNNPPPTIPLSRIIFPDETTSSNKEDSMKLSTTTAAPMEPIKFPQPVPEKLVDGTISVDNIYKGFRQDAYGYPQGIQNYFGGLKDEDNEVEDEDIRAKIKTKVITIPLDITLNVIENGVNGTDRLVIGDNDQIIVAGLANSSGFCLDESLVIAIFIFWLIFQILILFGCCLMVQRYKKMTSFDDDRSFNNSGYYPDSLENRHVRWADNTINYPRETYYQ